MGILNRAGWRALVTQDGNHFMQDSLELIVVQRVEEGYIPVVVTLERHPLLPTAYVDTAPVYELPKSTIPIELAEILLSSLAHYLIDTEGDIVLKIERLQRELNAANSRVDKLISVLGKIGEFFNAVIVTKP